MNPGQQSSPGPISKSRCKAKADGPRPSPAHLGLDSSLLAPWPGFPCASASPCPRLKKSALSMVGTLLSRWVSFSGCSLERRTGLKLIVSSAQCSQYSWPEIFWRACVP